MIECHHVEKRFDAADGSLPRRWRVDALAVSKGERVLIAGPSGCGKTTLLNLVAGLLHPDSGEITVNGARIDQLSVSAADVFRGRNIGLIFQSFQLLRPVSVIDNVLLGAHFGRKLPRHEAHARATELLSQVGLGDRRRQRPGHLSLGEQQRVAIARALINEPPLLLADEPTSSLDATNSGKVLGLLFDLCEANGTTLVAISHDQALASRFDRVIDASAWMSRDEGVTAGE